MQVLLVDLRCAEMKMKSLHTQLLQSAHFSSLFPLLSTHFVGSTSH